MENKVYCYLEVYCDLILKPKERKKEIDQKIAQIVKEFNWKPDLRYGREWKALNEDETNDYFRYDVDEQGYNIHFTTLTEEHLQTFNCTIGYGGYLDAHYFDERGALEPGKTFIKVFKTAVALFEDKIDYAVADTLSTIASYVWPNIYDERVNFFLITIPIFWLNYYPPKLVAKVGKETLLGIPAYRTEAVGKGIIVQTGPLPNWLLHDYSKDPLLKRLKKEFAELRETRNADLKEIREYFKEHKILKRLRSKELIK